MASFSSVSAILLHPSGKAAREDADDSNDGQIEEEVAILGHKVAAGRINAAEDETGKQCAGDGASTADRDDVMAFARGCMRSYLILKEKVQQFDADPEVKQILATLNVSNPEVEKLSKKFSKDNAKALKERKFDADALAAKPLPYERLDQKLFDILMGAK